MRKRPFLVIVESKSKNSDSVNFSDVPRVMKGCDLKFLDQEFDTDLTGRVISVPGKRKGLVIES